MTVRQLANEPSTACSTITTGHVAEDYGKEIIVAILYLLTTEDEALDPYPERQIVDWRR